MEALHLPHTKDEASSPHSLCGEGGGPPTPYSPLLAFFGPVPRELVYSVY